MAELGSNPHAGHTEAGAPCWRVERQVVDAALACTAHMACRSTLDYDVHVYEGQAFRPDAVTPTPCPGTNGDEVIRA
jgi:hypothetical protein